MSKKPIYNLLEVTQRVIGHGEAKPGESLTLPADLAEELLRDKDRWSDKPPAKATTKPAAKPQAEKARKEGGE